MIFNNTSCELGEGPLWHPERNELFWFDIIGKRLYVQDLQNQTQHWQFDEYVSAASWLNDTDLLIASASSLSLFNTDTGAQETLTPLEADNPITRSNDGRADPWGGFWIGTMGINAQAEAGAIYRYYRGELRQLFPNITIPNAICFAPNGDHAYFADTATGKVYKQRLAASDGWPEGDPDLWLDFNGTGLNPDGAVVDASGNFWNAQWGASRVACYAPDASLLTAIPFPATQISCPAFGGADLSTLYCTSAAIDLDDDNPDQGKTFAHATDTKGQPEPKFIL